MDDTQLKEYRQMVYKQVMYLTSCYPNLKWDGILTAGAWTTALIEINATEKEITKVCHRLVRNGYEDYKINISLIIKHILDDREDERSRKETMEYIEYMNSLKPVSEEKFKEIVKGLFNEQK